MYDENPIRTSLFAQILPSISKELLRTMELKGTRANSNPTLPIFHP